MLTRTDRRRFPVLLAVIAALALAMAMLFSPVQAQEGSAPDKPRGLDATATHDSVTLTWDDPQDDTITGYVILRRIPAVDPEGQFSELVSDTGTDATTYTDDTVSAETRYTYRIKAINEHGVSERSRWVHINVPAAPEPEEEQAAEPPDKPRGLEATATHDSVTLTWDDPGDDTITGYVILRRIPAVDPEGQFSELVSDTGTDATTYTDDTVSAETRYTYRIKAINEHGVSERSRWVHINVPAAPEPEEEQAAEPPDKPRGLEATATHDSVTLTWDDPGDDTITGYVILRRIPAVDPEGQFSELVSDTGTDATTYTDDTVSAETRYTYRIKAINGAGTSERSRWSHVNVPAAPEAAEGDEQDGEGAPGGPGKRAPKSPRGATATVLVSNIEETHVGTNSLHDEQMLAQAFSIATGSGNYTLTSIEIPIRDNGIAAADIGSLSVSVWSTDSSAVPSASLHTLTNPGSITANTTATFNAQSGMTLTLEAGNTYAVVVRYDKTLSTNFPNWSKTDEYDQSGAVGWEIADESLSSEVADVQWFSSDLDIYRMRINGTAASDDEPPCTLNEGDIWCGVVDVGEVRSTADVLTGHGFVGITGRETGGLAGHPDDTMFSVGDNDYTIQGIYVGAGTNNEGALFFLLNADLSDDDEGILVLAFDGVTTLRPLDDATKLNTGLYQWGTDLDWSSTTEVTVRLQTPSDDADDADDPPVTLPTLSIADAAGDEDEGVEFTATLTVGVSGKVTATWTATIESDDTAVAADLATMKTGDVEFAENATSAKFTVPVNDDTIDEDNETFTVTLSGVSENAQLAADPTAKGTILDDDDAADDPVDDSGTEEDDLPADTSTSGVVEVDGYAATSFILEPVKETVTWMAINDEGDEVERTSIVYDFDTDWFAVELEAGRTYRIDMKGAIPTNDLTLRLPEIHAIYDADGVDLPNTSSRDATDDANSSHHLARVEFTPEDDGTYYIAATGEAHEWGSYELTVIDITQDDDEHPADRSTTGRVIVGILVTGKIDFNRDVDWFKLNISAETRYQIDLEGQETDSGSLRDPLLLGVYDADGNYISGTRNDDGGEVFNARISRTLKVGIYYVAVGAFGNGEGTYTLTVAY